MIIGEVKPLEEIKSLIKGYRKILNTGCGGCTAVCLAGGQKEVDTLNTKLSLSFKADHVPLEIDGFTVERQCEVEFIREFDTMVGKYDAILSMACGAGIQFLAERARSEFHNFRDRILPAPDFHENLTRNPIQPVQHL